MLLHSLNINAGDKPKVVFMQMDLNKGPSAPTLFDGKLENIENGPNEKSLKDIQNFLEDVLENKIDGGIEKYKKLDEVNKKTEL